MISGRSPFLAAFWGILFSVAIGQVHLRTMAFFVPMLLATPPVACSISAPCKRRPGCALPGSAVGLVGLVITFRRSDRLTWVLGVLTSGLLAGLLFSGVETSLSAFWTTMAVVAIGMCYKESKMRIPDLMDALHWGTKNALAIGAACACVGFIVGATTLTGLGLKFAATVLKLATNVVAAISYVNILHLVDQDAFTLFFTLVFMALACFILGMGIPTTAQYIVASMIAAPALLQWHILPLVSHMFVFYYSILADVTPPVALAAYAASGISGADPFRTGLRAFTLSSGGFIIPFVFVSAPVVLWLPGILDGKTLFDYMWFAQVCVTMFLGVIALSSTVIGYMKDRSRVWERVVTGIAAAFLILPESITDVIGFVLLVVVYLVQRARKRRREIAPAIST